MKRAGKTAGDNDEVDLTGDGGILKKIVKEGTGDVIPNGVTAVVHYTGKFLDGKVFDSSVTRGQPFKFTVGARQVILGWDKGVATMKKGEKCVLTCAPDYAYGNRGVGPIPGGSTLVFDVELLDWNEGGQSFLGSATPVVTIILFIAFAIVILRSMGGSGGKKE